MTLKCPEAPLSEIYNIKEVLKAHKSFLLIFQLQDKSRNKQKWHCLRWNENKSSPSFTKWVLLQIKLSDQFNKNILNFLLLKEKF